MYDAIILDLDGTIVNEDNTISEITIKTLKKCNENGIRIILATGRGYMDTIKLFENHETFKYSKVMLNGSQWRDENDIIIENEGVEESAVCEVVKIAGEYEVGVGLYGTKTIYSVGYTDKSSFKNEFTNSFSQVENYTVNDYLVEINSMQEMVPEIITKIEIIEHDEMKRFNIEKKLKKVAEIEIATSGYDNLEITKKNIDKSFMVNKVLRKLSIENSKVIIFGDSLNDISLFSNFPYVVATGNACGKIKELSWEICGNCKDDGVARYLIDKLKL